MSGWSGCSGCQRKDALSFVAKDALFVAYVPSLDEAITAEKRFLSLFREQMFLKLAIEKGKSSLVKELGLDFENPDRFREKGIDPSKDVALSMSMDSKRLFLTIRIKPC